MGSYTSPSAATGSRVTDRDYLLDSSQQSWDSSSVEVFEEVLWRGGSVVWLTTLGGGGVGTKVAGVDPPVMAVGGIPITTYRAWCCQRYPFCLFAVLLRASIESHILNYVFP
ncbi:UNVERIFIED_CONTAM: hypothetical protein Sradi_5183100 [Sesamum radiatum]|uniref:Uncharacterized protein n=1 Tax=Sesamum radiatum TaxID=300843 RepID=A0AAW2M6I5_SESRA